MTRTIPIIGILLLIAAILLGILVWWPKFQQFRNLTSELKIKTEALEQKRAYFANIDEILNRLQEEQYKDSVDKIETALPESVSVPELFNFILIKAAENGMAAGNITSGEGQQGGSVGGAQSFPFSASFTGSYSAFKNFLSVLNKSSRLIEVDSISFAAGQGESAFTFNLGMNIPYYSGQAPAVFEQLPGVDTGSVLP